MYILQRVKSSIFLFLFVSLPFLMQAQIEKISEGQKYELSTVKRAGMTTFTLSYSVKGSDTTYLLLFKDARYPRLNTFGGLHFDEVGGTLESLYQTLKEAMDAPAKKQTTFKLGETIVSVESDRVMGYKVLTVSSEEGAFDINPKELDKLFKKR
jgi:hypothetical protein